MRGSLDLSPAGDGHNDFRPDAPSFTLCSAACSRLLICVKILIRGLFPPRGLKLIPIARAQRALASFRSARRQATDDAAAHPLARPTGLAVGHPFAGREIISEGEPHLQELPRIVQRDFERRALSLQGGEHVARCMNMFRRPRDFPVSSEDQCPRKSASASGQARC